MSASPRPMTPAHPGGEILCYRYKSSKAEVAFLTEYLKTRIAELPELPKAKDGIVCLFPSRRVLNCYFDLLSPSVPCVQRKTSVPTNRLWLERVLQLIKRPRQRFLERLFLNDYTDVKPRYRRMIVDRIVEKDLTPSAACESLLLDNSLIGEAAAAARAFCSACAAIASNDPALIAPVIAQSLGVQKATVLQQLQALIAATDEMAQDDIIAGVCDTLLPDTAAQQEDPRTVLFLTMHGSKGLTKKTVVIPGLEEAWLPGTATARALPEQQRLFYVAITRATDYLLLTFPHNRGRNDPLNFNIQGRGKPSSFIASTGLVAVYHA
jgi:hypothetical protein